MKRIVLVRIFNLFACSHFFSFKNFLLRKLGYSIGRNVKIVGPIHLDDIILSLGDNVWIGPYFYAFGNGKVFVGKNVDIGPNVKLFSGSHNIGNKERRAGIGYNTDIYISDGTWIGGDVNIGPGVFIGESSVIAFGSSIYSNVDKNNLVASNFQVLKKRLI